jgi:hypothetical protein
MPKNIALLLCGIFGIACAGYRSEAQRLNLQVCTLTSPNVRTPGLQILLRISCVFLVLPEAALEIVREDAKLREVMAICIL